MSSDRGSVPLDDALPCRVDLGDRIAVRATGGGERDPAPAMWLGKPSSRGSAPVDRSCPSQFKWGGQGGQGNRTSSCVAGGEVRVRCSRAFHSVRKCSQPNFQAGRRLIRPRSSARSPRSTSEPCHMGSVVVLVVHREVGARDRSTRTGRGGGRAAAGRSRPSRCRTGQPGRDHVAGGRCREGRRRRWRA